MNAGFQAVIAGSFPSQALIGGLFFKEKLHFGAHPARIEVFPKKPVDMRFG